MIPIIDTKDKPEFIIGSRVKTSLQYDKFFKEHIEGNVCDIKQDIIIIRTRNGKKSIGKSWLINA